jgi:hypothetical protein
MGADLTKEVKASLPSEDPKLANEIERQNEELESVKNDGVGLDDSELQVEFVKDGRVQSTVIYPYLVGLNEGEVLLWSFVNRMKGIINKTAVESLAVTNFRIVRIDELNKKVYGYIPISTLDDIVVMNTQLISESMGYALYTESYAELSGPQFSSGTSRIVGDIIFLVHGQQVPWLGIPDPEGLKNFILSIKKIMYDPLTDLQTKTYQAEIKCGGCGLQNARDSKFCNGCGKSLSTICSKCGNSNPFNSSYCNKCGFTLQ